MNQCSSGLTCYDRNVDGELPYVCECNAPFTQGVECTESSGKYTYKGAINPHSATICSSDMSGAVEKNTWDQLAIELWKTSKELCKQNKIRKKNP